MSKKIINQVLAQVKDAEVRKAVQTYFDLPSGIVATESKEWLKIPATVRMQAAGFITKIAREGYGL